MLDNVCEIGSMHMQHIVVRRNSKNLDAASVPFLKCRRNIVEHHPFDFFALESSSPDVALHVMLHQINEENRLV